MKEYFCSYEQSLAIRELGFDEPCMAIYNSYTNEFCYNPYPSNFSSEDAHPLPLKSQFFKWVRDKHNIFQPQQFIYETIGGKYGLQSMDEYDQTDGIFDTYEQAEDACINKIIDLIKQKQFEEFNI